MLEHQKEKLLELFKATESPTDMEETKLMIEDDHETRATQPKMTTAKIHLAVLLISMFMFVLGALMVVSTINYKQSDRSCAAQLSIWCKSRHSIVYANSSDLDPFLAPLFQAVEYEERDWESIFTKKHSDWTGAPTVELEDRWHRLVNGVSSFCHTSSRDSNVPSADSHHTRRSCSSPQPQHRARFCEGRSTRARGLHRWD
jgi:hypothetical protein